MHEIYKKRVQTLLESLPYIRMFSGSTMVIKYGGAAMSKANLKEEFATDIALLRYVGIKPVIVHGGGDEISAYMEKLGLPVKFVDGLRVTDEAAMEVAKMVLVGKVNKEIVSLINSKGAPAVGLCGDDGRLLKAEPLVRRGADGTVLDLGLVGRVIDVNIELLTTLEADYVPVWWPRWGRVSRARASTSTPILSPERWPLLSKPRRSSSLPMWRAHEGSEDTSTIISECTDDEVRQLIESGKVSRG